MSKKPKTGVTAALRRVAEEHGTMKHSKASDPAAQSESVRLMHELMVHQAELEMQNEELREARIELESSTEHFTELYEFAPVAYFSLAVNGEIRQLNLLGARMLGGERRHLIGSMFGEFVSAGHRQKFDRFLAELLAGNAMEPCEVALMPQGLAPASVKLNGSLSPNGLVCRIAAIDVTEQRRVEESAREKNEDLDRIFNLSSDLLGISTLSGRFIRLNPAFNRLLGYSLEDLTSRDFIHFVHPDDREATLQVMSELKSGRDIMDFVNRYRCKDGSYRWLEWRATPYRGEFICSMARDITARKQVEDALRVSEEKFRSIVESSPMAMYLYRLEPDDRLVLVGANPAADKETGIKHESLVGMTVEQAFPKLVDTDVPAMYKRVAKGDLETQSFVIRYEDERITGYFDVHVFQTGPGTIVVAFLDISAHKQAEEALKKSQDELELRVQRRTAQLQERTSQLRALASEMTLAEERERRRIARLIHDHLQQMLVAALLNLGMAKSKLENQADVAELDHIEGILRDSIETTRSLTAELSPAVLHQCGLAAALNWLSPWCMEKYGLEVRVETEEDIDPGLDVSVTLFLSVRELLFNIVKHSGVKLASLRMWRPPQGEEVRIEVSDKGAGFDPALVRAREGTTGGFGLFNIRERLELLGGGFETESTPGRGSRITLWVPFSSNMPAGNRMDDSGGSAGRPETHLQGASVPMPVGRTPRRIRLVVADDHAAVREGLVRLFQAEPDLEVVGQAVDGHEALQLARELRPDFVIMDLNMPRMDGMEATAAIRSELPSVRILGLSTYADEEHRSAMIRAGAVDLLHKNNPASQLVSILRGHMGTKG